jgi:hypothetical protein
MAMSLSPLDAARAYSANVALFSAIGLPAKRAGSAGLGCNASNAPDEQKSNAKGRSVAAPAFRLSSP